MLWATNFPGTPQQQKKEYSILLMCCLIHILLKFPHHLSPTLIMNVCLPWFHFQWDFVKYLFVSVVRDHWFSRESFLHQIICSQRVLYFHFLHYYVEVCSFTVFCRKLNERFLPLTWGLSSLFLSTISGKWIVISLQHSILFLIWWFSIPHFICDRSVIILLVKGSP